jgi:hypothetical protein
MFGWEGSGAMRTARRFALIAALVAGVGFAAPHAALAQNTDDAHALCAQGGGEDPGAGAGGGNPNVAVDTQGSGLENALALAGGGGSGTDDGAGPGGGLAGGGLAGSDDGGGAGGCGPEETAPPVQVVLRQPNRRLPTTGTAADRFGFGGTALVLAGGALLVARRRSHRKSELATSDLVWDAFGESSA